MSVLLVASASGAPGVTTMALHLAYRWPEPALLIEADLCGGDLLGRFDGLDPARGLVSVAASLSRGIDEAVLSANTQDIGSGGDDPGLPVIVGPTDPSTTAVVAQAWGQIIFAASKMSDVVVDVGRLVPSLIQVQKTLIDTADLVLVVLRPDLPGALHTRALVATLSAMGTPTMLAIVGDGFAQGEVEEAVGAEVAGCLCRLPGEPFGRTRSGRKARPPGKSARDRPSATNTTSELARRLHDEMGRRRISMATAATGGSPSLGDALAAMQPDPSVPTQTGQPVPTSPLIVGSIGSVSSVSSVSSVDSVASVGSANGGAR